MVKVSNSLQDIADAGKDAREAVGYGLRVMAAKANIESHINTDATTTNRQEHVDDCVGGSDRDGVASQKTLSRRKGVNPIDRLALTTIKYKNLLLEVVEAGLERASLCRACLYLTYELKGDGSKHKTHSCKPLTSKAKVTPSSKIEEGLRQSTPRSKEIKEASPAESTAPAGEVQAAPAEPAGIKAEESTADGIAETVLQEDITTDDIDGLVLRDSADQECLRPVKLLVEQLGDTAALEDVTADNVMTRTLTNYDESQ